MNTATAYDKIARRNAAQEFNSAWGVTMPAELLTVQPPAPYHEPIRGLVTREVDEPELFKLFFG